MLNFLGLLLVSLTIAASAVRADSTSVEIIDADSGHSGEMDKADEDSAQTTQEIGLERASPERTATAMGHYARARSLLIAAVKEFDRASQVANPEAILDGQSWRATLIDRASELETLLSPNPRQTKGGARYEADSRLLGNTVR